MAEKLELRLLGNPELYLAGQPLGRFRSAKAYALLYYLVASRRAQPRTVLAGLFWGDVDEYYARRNFNRTLSDVAQFVGDHLVIERQTVALARNQPYWLDVEALEEVVTLQPTAHNVNALAAAADLYRGDFLEGFYVQEAPEFEQWVLTERTRLRATGLHLLDTLAQYQATQGNLPQAMSYARRILQLEPWREEAHRQLMLWLAQSGQRSAALAQYELCRQALRSELEVEPDAVTLELVERVRTGNFDKVRLRQAQPLVTELVEVTLSPPHLVTAVTPPHNLPGERTPFIGRTAELAEITRLLLEEADCRLLTLVGPGGMGKTRLALKAAEGIVAAPLLSERFGDGVFFVPLENVSDANGLLSAVISAISEESGFPLQVDAPLQEQLVHFLRTRAMLLVLDNFEHLVQHAEICSALLTAAPRVKLLVTARESLGLQEAWFYPVLGLSIPQGRPERPARGADDAVQLFVQCARRTRPDFALDKERAAVVRICTLVEGMPLGIELATTWLKLMSCEQIAQQVAQGLDFLTARYQNIPARHRSMRAVMDHSWALLAPEEREAIARLSIFRGAFRQAAAETITGASLFTLATLVEKALVRVTPDGDYQLHELTRQYAAEQLAGGEQSALRNAHARYYAQLLHQQRPHLFTAAYRQVWATVGGELDNIRHGWQWLIDGVSTVPDLPLPVLLRQMAAVLANYYLFHSLFLPGEALVQQAVQVLRAAGWSVGEPDQQSTLVHIQLLNGLFHFEMGHYRASLAIAEQMLPVCRAAGTEEDLLLALVLYGRTQMRRGVHAEAIAALQEAFALGQQLGQRHVGAETLINLGMEASNVGRYLEAQEYLRQALALCQEIGYRPWTARALTNLGTTYSRQHDYQPALPYYEAALAIAQAEDDQGMIMINTSNLGGVQRSFGRYPLSLELYQRSLAMARNLGEDRWIAANLNGIAITYLEMNDLTTAERSLREALAVGQQSESTPDTLGSITLLGHLWARRGQLEMALKALAFVEQHPATMARDRLYTQPLLSELHSELAAALFEEAANWAADQTLDGVVHWLLHSEGAIPVRPQFATLESK